MGIARLGYWHQFSRLICRSERVFNVTQCAAWVVRVTIAVQAIVLADTVAAQLPPPTCNPATIAATWQDNGTVLRVTVSGVANATVVRVPTWNLANVPNPIIWYYAVDDGYGTWIADIRPAPLAESGWYAS